MARIHQRYLGASPQQTLCLALRPSYPSPKPLGKCFISTLPDELLVEILEHLAPEHSLYLGSIYAECLSILVVCERWQRLYEPILYRKIDLGYSGWRKTRRTINLVRTLKQRSDLPNHVQVVGFHGEIAAGRVVTDVLKCCKSIRKLWLHGDMSSAAWPMIHAAGQLPRLEALALTGGPALQMILAHFDLPTLRKLNLSRYGSSINGEPGAPWDNVVRSTNQQIDDLFSTYYHKGAMSIFELNEPCAPPHFTQCLLQWPAQLVNLTFTHMIHSRYARHYTVDAMQQILDTQQDSLRHIVLCGIVSYAIPDFSTFPRLDTLQLHQRNLFAETPYRASLKLAAPSLRYLTIEFCTEDQHETPPTAFSTDQVRWFDEFASHVTSESTTTHMLETIFVNFAPYDTPWSVDDFGGPVWPWVYLKQAVQALAERGLTMKYSTPTSTEEEWNERLNDQRKVRESRDARSRPGTIESHFPSV